MNSSINDCSFDTVSSVSFLQLRGIEKQMPSKQQEATNEASDLLLLLTHCGCSKCLQVALRERERLSSNFGYGAAA